MTGPADPAPTWQERALAAERAVVVLKAKVKALYAGSGSAIQRQLERAREREVDVRRRQELMAVRNAELKRYSETLEGEVAARTRAIQTILDNVTFGFLVVGPDLRVRDGYTRSCHELLGAAALAGSHLADLLGLEHAARLELACNVEQVFEDLLPEELTLGQMPGRHVVRGRVLRFEGRLVRDAGAPSAVLFTITDATALEQARRETAEHKLLVHLLKQRDAFRTFLDDVQHQLRVAREAVARGDEVTLRRAVHTVKGNASSFGLDDISTHVHQVERSAAIVAEQLDGIEALFRRFLARHGDVLDMQYESTGEGSYQVREDAVEELEGLVGELQGDVGRAVHRWASQVTRKPVRALLGPVDTLVKRLSERLEKEVLFELTGADVLVDVRRMRPVLQNLSHLVRNALDHGIEPAEGRGDKPARGTLHIDVQEEGERYHVLVEDDGRGIDDEALTQQAVRLGLVSAEEASGLSREARLGLMFVDGLSTATRASETSGCGVGVSAVKAAVERSGGELRVSTAPGVGTRFHLYIPKAAPTPEGRGS